MHLKYGALSHSIFTTYTLILSPAGQQSQIDDNDAFLSDPDWELVPKNWDLIAESTAPYATVGNPGTMSKPAFRGREF